MAYLVVACPQCGSRRVVPAGQKTAQCTRCPARIDLAIARALFSAASVDAARAFIGEAAARDAGRLPGFRREVAASDPAPDARARELRNIAESIPAATGRLNQLKLILRKGFAAFGEITVTDLERIAREAGMAGSGEDLSSEIVEMGLAGRSATGALVPLREGR